MTERDEPYTPSLGDVHECYAAMRADYRTPRAQIDAEFESVMEAVREKARQEERERYDPEKDERLARYMAMVTPLGYATATAAVEAMTQLIDAERRAEEIAEKARQEERRRVQHAWKREGETLTAFCGEPDVRPPDTAPETVEEANAIPLCTLCHKRAMKAARQEERERCARIVRDLNAEYREQGITAQRWFAVEADARIRGGGR